MANRTTVKSNILTKNVPTVTNEILTDMLNADMADNLVFREDVVVAQSSSVTNITLDFTGKDRIDVTRTGGAITFTVSNLADGDVKYILVNKSPSTHIGFVNVLDKTPLNTVVNEASLVLYQLFRKGSNIFAWAVYDTITAKIATMDATEANHYNTVQGQVTALNSGVSSHTTQIASHTATLATHTNILTNHSTLITELQEMNPTYQTTHRINFSGWNASAGGFSIIHGVNAAKIEQWEVYLRNGTSEYFNFRNTITLFSTYFRLSNGDLTAYTNLNGWIIFKVIP